MEIKKNQYYVVRCDRAGVFFGKVKELGERSITMTEVRKLWHWDGACAVEELALNGTAKPNSCKFTVIIEEMQLADPIQIIPCTDKAAKSLSEVKVWSF